MTLRRLTYLVVLAGCLVLYMFYREWLAWLLLVAVACIPLFSLLISLPAMCTVKTSLRCPTEVSVGQLVRPELDRHCRLPAPPVRCKMKLRHCITGDTNVIKLGKPLPTGNCGTLEIVPTRLWVCDYLGLWRFPTRRKAPCRLTVLPEPVKPDKLPDPRHYMASSWRPKPGGGFSENHDLRLYRPGDDLRNIHWKLSAKTGKLIFREPVEPVRKQLLVTMELSGNYTVLDNKLGRLLWITEHFLETGVPHEIRCLTGRGVQVFRITDRDTRQIVLRTLLSAPACRETETIPMMPGAFHIGGDSHET